MQLFLYRLEQVLDYIRGQFATSTLQITWHNLR
jgi:hypothetical protein